MATENPSQILEATESFVCELNGQGRVIVQAGTTRVAAGHDLVKTYPERFRPIEEGLIYAEDATATAEPGEPRSATRTRRSPQPAEQTTSKE